MVGNRTYNLSNLRPINTIVFIPVIVNLANSKSGKQRVLVFFQVDPSLSRLMKKSLNDLEVPNLPNAVKDSIFASKAYPEKFTFRLKSNN